MFSRVIPEYAREYKNEYLYIRGINKEFRYILINLDDLNSGLFESNKVNRIKKIIKRYLRGVEIGKLRDISGLVFNEYEVDNIIKIKENFSKFKLRYDFCIEGDDGFDPSPGFKEFYDIFCIEGDDGFDPYPGFKEFYDICESFYNDIKFISDSDSDREELDLSYTDSDLEDFTSIVKSLVSKSESDSD